MTVVLLSGGMDSTTLLYKALQDRKDIKAISFNYGQRHSKELKYAEATCKRLRIPWHMVDLSSITPLLGDNSLTDMSVEVPEGHYEAESMKLTVVPNRNMIMASIAAAWALATEKVPTIAMAVHAGDHAIYPDCRPMFITRLQTALMEANDKFVYVWTPFLNNTKADIAQEGDRLGVPWDQTWSCYKGGDEPCGKCGTCVEREEALASLR